jgi:hypothetical protein
MKLRFPFEESFVLLAVVCVLALIPVGAQQENGSQQKSGTTPSTLNEKAEVRVEKYNVKQDFGPQSVSRRGDRMSAATPSGQNNNSQGTSGGKGANGSSDAIKQDFGPQSVSRRGDRMTVATPAGQGSGGKGQAGSGATTHQDSAPAAHSSRHQTTNSTPKGNQSFNSLPTAGSQGWAETDGRAPRIVANAIAPGGVPRFLSPQPGPQSSQ